MKKSSIVILSVVGGLLLLGILTYFLLPSLIVVPPQKVAIIVPSEDVPQEIIAPGAPKVIFIGVTTIPLDLAGSQNVFSNVVVTFSEAMDPATVNEDTFTMRGPNNLNLDGSITSDSTGKIWTFNPTNNLQFDTLYDLTVTTGAKGVSGNSLVGDFLWSFTTDYRSSGGSGGSSTFSAPSAPPVLTTITLSPTSSSLSVGSTQQLTPTKLDQFGSPIDATVIYNTSNSSIATVNSSGFVTAVALGNATITATSGAIGGASIVYVTVPSCPAVAVDLGTAGNFAILAKSGISTTGATSIIGDLGVSPIDSTAITGFGLVVDANNTFATSSLVTGRIYAPDYIGPPSTTEPMLTTAVSDMETAYTTAAGLADCVTELGDGEIGGMTLAPGAYKWGTGLLVSTDVTLSGNSTDVWVFEVAGTLGLANAQEVILSGGALAENIYWVVGDVTTLGTTSVMNGNILSAAGVAVDEAIVLNTGATLNGRALSQKAVTLDANSVTKPA